ncbi:Zinc finger, C3HC4 RING-type [Dillenia turbinata]|uniref:RBR-type E3 ubiquitin transferase n=1 Tax=Dillenia turbinata TaxID=194707 RepID=A0AAN8VXI1_9MAGN
MATPDSDDLHSLISEQHRELMAAKTLESDLDFAFRLQMQEAITASLHNLPSSSSSPPLPSMAETNSPPEVLPDDVFNFASLQAEEIDRYEQERRDSEQSEALMIKLITDVNRRIHDQKLAREIESVPEDEWMEYGDNIERPFVADEVSGPISSSSSSSLYSNLASKEVFRLYFKGLVNRVRVGNSDVDLGSVGIAICDPHDNLVFELKRPMDVSGTGRKVVELKALIEGLDAASSLGLPKIVYFIDYYPLYQYMVGRWLPKQQKVATLVGKVFLLHRKFKECAVSLVPRNDIKFAIKLAREAIESQITRPTNFCSQGDLKEACIICLEDTVTNQMFQVDGCQHRFCFSCMKQHTEVKLLHGMMPKCPYEGCDSDLKIDSCEKFLTPKLTEIMRQRVKELSIPVNEKVYCPYPRCSALMSKTEVLIHSNEVIFGAQPSEVRKCTKCNGLFCINCKVPWHNNVTCYQYKRLNPYPRPEEAKLKSLATRNLWRQCSKCNHMIELAEGCYHMTCRCGFEFCYTCGAEWKNKKATCSCPLWDEHNILYDEDDFDENEEEEF